MIHFLGIDVSKATFDVAFRTPKRIIHKVFRNETSGFEQLAKFLRSKKVEKAHACLEATGTYAYELSLFLLEKSHLVTQVNPLRIKGHKQSLSIHGKNDKLDAIVILDYAERFRDNLRLWEPPPPKMQRLRALLTRREQLIVMEQMESNRLKVSISSEEEHRSVERLYSFLQEEKEKIEKELKELFKSDEAMAKDLKNLMSIPGVGVTTAMMTIQLVGDIHRFESARQLAAFVGVAPYPKESGTSVRGGSKISRRGNSHYRKVLYMAALSAKLHNPGFQDFARKKDAEGKPKKVVTLAVARKLLHLMFAILKSKKPYDVEKVATSRLKAESMRKEKAKKSEK